MTPPFWATAPARFELPADEVHVWRIALDRPPEAVARLAGTLAPDERARAERFRFERHRDHFTVGRGSLRAILGDYLGIAADRVEFRYEAYGKPTLAGGPAGLKFNLTHSHGMALVAVARGRALGIDVEQVRPMTDFARIIERFFSPRECAEFRGLPDEEKLSAFFRCWTRKEAYMKATGEGFSLPLEKFDVSLAPGAPAQLLRVEGRPGEPSRWSMHDLDVGPDYRAAILVEGPATRLRGFDHSLLK